MMRLQVSVQALSKALLLSGVALLASGNLACTGEKPGSMPQIKAPDREGPTKALATKGEAPICSPEEINAFERQEGEVVDLDRESLPAGLFLATVSEILVEKRNEMSISRMLVREQVGAKAAEIVCAEGTDKFGQDFELSLAGLVKFDTTEKPQGSGFTLRQFYLYQDKSGYGVVLSNPRLNPANAELKKLVKGVFANGQLSRLNENEYVLRYARERDAVRARLQIRLELVR